MPLRGFTLMVLSMTLCGCGAVQLPPSLTESERALITDAHVPLTVGVERYETPVYSESLLKALQATNFFDRVCRLEECDTPPDLVASVARPVHGSSEIPVVTGLTLGVVPQSVDESHGDVFYLRSANDTHGEVLIDSSYSSKTVHGYLGGARLASKDWVYGDPDDTSRYAQRLTLQLVQAAGEITTVAKTQ